MNGVTLAEKIACIEGMLTGKHLNNTRDILQAVLADLQALANEPPRKIIDRMTYRAGAEAMRERAAQCVEQIVIEPALSITMRERTAKAIRALPVE